MRRGTIIIFILLAVITCLSLKMWDMKINYDFISRVQVITINKLDIIIAIQDSQIKLKDRHIDRQYQMIKEHLGIK